MCASGGSVPSWPGMPLATTSSRQKDMPGFAGLTASIAHMAVTFTDTVLRQDTHQQPVTRLRVQLMLGSAAGQHTPQEAAASAANTTANMAAGEELSTHMPATDPAQEQQAQTALQHVVALHRKATHMRAEAGLAAELARKELTAASAVLGSPRHSSAATVALIKSHVDGALLAAGAAGEMGAVADNYLDEAVQAAADALSANTGAKHEAGDATKQEDNRSSSSSSGVGDSEQLTPQAIAAATVDDLIAGEAAIMHGAAPSTQAAFSSHIAGHTRDDEQQLSVPTTRGIGRATSASTAAQGDKPAGLLHAADALALPVAVQSRSSSSTSTVERGAASRSS